MSFFMRLSIDFHFVLDQSIPLSRLWPLFQVNGQNIYRAVTLLIALTVIGLTSLIIMYACDSFEDAADWPKYEARCRARR